MMISFLYDFIYTFPIYVVSLILFGDVLRLPAPGIVFYVLSIIITGVIIGLRHVTRSLGLLLTGVLSVIAAGVIWVQKPEQRQLFIQEHLWIGWMLLFAVIVYLLGRLVISSKILKLCVAIALVATTIVTMCGLISPDRIIVALAFFELLLYLVEYIQSTWVKSGYTDNRVHLVLVTPFILLMCLIIHIIPVREEPYDWKFVRLAGQRIVELAKISTRYIPGKNDDYVEVGFSENTALAGLVQPRPKDIIELSASKTNGNTIYLSGKSFDTFTGREWENTYIEDNNDRLIDMLETWCSVMAYDPDYANDYIKSTELRFKYQVFNTKYIFIPSKAYLGSGKLNDIEYYDMSNALVAAKELGYGTEYMVHYYRLNKDNEVFANWINDNKGFDEDLWKYKCGKDIDVSYDDFLKHKNDTIVNYSQSIEVSPDLQTMLDNLYAGAETKWEKLNRLEKWIATYKYTNDPGELPGNIQTPENFLDYFMLEKQEGYCVHFATAFTLLARAEGLPARMVQGYVVNRRGQKDVTIKSDMAHAWSEVYFENVGWIPFDPTPGYNHNVSWQVADRDVDKTAQQVYGPEYYEMLKEMYMNDDIEEEEVVDELDIDVNGKNDINIMLVVVPLLLVLLFIGLFGVVYGYFVQKKYNSFDEIKRARILCKLNMLILEMIGHSIQKGETLEEYGKSLEGQVPSDALLFIEGYERLTYGNVSDSKELLAIVQQANNEFMNILKEQKRYLTVLYKLKLLVRFSSLFG